jgi:hypothetical protein
MDPEGDYDNPSDDGLTNDSSPINTHLDAPMADDFHYASADEALLQSIETEAAFSFPPGRIYENLIDCELRQDVRSFAYQKGFEVTSHASSLSCTRCSQPNYDHSSCCHELRLQCTLSLDGFRNH